MAIIGTILLFPFLQGPQLCTCLATLVIAGTSVLSFEDMFFCSRAFYFVPCCVGFEILPMLVLIIIFLIFLSPPGNFFSTVPITAFAFARKSSSYIVSSPILHASDREFFSLTLIEDLNLSNIESIGALNGTGVGIFPLGPMN